MIPKMSINLCWDTSEKNTIENYKKWIDTCEKNKIEVIRIISCSWSINFLYEHEDMRKLIEIIEYAKIKNIEICLVLNNFVDFNIKNYNDINNERYSWIANKYSDYYKKPTNFFKNVDKEYLNNILNVLFKIYEYDNICYIEIMNEIDQIHCNKRVLANWCNKINKNIIDKFPNRYKILCSISNYALYEYYKRKLNCFVDLHFYSFPYESAYRNIEKYDVLSFEYAKNSDKHYLQDYNSKIYFCSGIWGAFILKRAITPMHWWWQELLSNKNYLTIMDVLSKNVSDFGEILDVTNYNVSYELLYSNSEKRESNKIIQRLINLIKHPSFIVNEFKSIRKFIIKKLKKEELTLCRKVKTDKCVFYYLETYSFIKILNQELLHMEAIDLITGEKFKVKSVEKLCGNFIIY
ncbi:MAG: hypothetical protein FWF46_08395 [Oscillospiraceae bacterium]|nr:hypothetical protein [Oscillospiraceae bacterium]